MIAKVLKISKPTKEQRKLKNVRGALRKYANPKLVESEKTAWIDAVEEKYATH